MTIKFDIIKNLLMNITRNVCISENRRKISSNK